MATNLSDLDFTLVLMKDSAKIVRVAGNFLMHSPIRTLLDHWVNDTQTFYTHAQIEYKGRVLKTFDLSDRNELARYV